MKNGKENLRQIILKNGIPYVLLQKSINPNSSTGYFYTQKISLKDYMEQNNITTIFF
jgi:hypothetical protein